MRDSAQNLLVGYSVVVSIAIAVMLLTGARSSTTASFDEIRVQRIAVVEPDGTLRMVVSDHARFPGIIIRGKEKPFRRPNQEGDTAA